MLHSWAWAMERSQSRLEQCDSRDGVERSVITSCPLLLYYLLNLMPKSVCGDEVPALPCDLSHFTPQVCSTLICSWVWDLQSKKKMQSIHSFWSHYIQMYSTWTILQSCHIPESTYAFVHWHSFEKTQIPLRPNQTMTQRVCLAHPTPQSLDLRGHPFQYTARFGRTTHFLN